MARVPTNDDFTQFFGTHDAAEKRQQEENDAARRRVTREAVDLGEPLLQFLAALPGAVMASQHAELERLTAIDKQHPRAAQVNAMIDQIGKGAPVGTRVFSRAMRGLEVARSRQPGLYGFVASDEGVPLSGLIVRVGEGKGAPSAKTEADGYFMVPLLLNPNDPTRNVPNDSKSEARARVETPSGEVLYEDPTPVNVLIGFDYREYVVATPTHTPYDKPEPQPQPGPEPTPTPRPRPSKSRKK